MDFKIPPTRPWAALGLAMLLSACAVLSPQTSEALVKERAQERWDALIAGDFKRAYGYLSPASRAAVPFETYRGGFGVASAWKAATVDSVKCEAADRCIATVVIKHQPLAMRNRLGTIESALDETWLLDDGNWWLPYRP